MKQVVTIDFDIIMAPSISWYNNMVPKVQWKDLEKDPLCQFFSADLVHYHRLTQWILHQTEHLSKDQIIFIASHEKAIDYFQDDEFYEVVNIDHHHDLGYLANEDNTKIDCSNWMASLFDKRIINKYTWLNNKNSDRSSIKSEYPTTIKELVPYDLSQLNSDLLIICFSPEWVPPQYQRLFYVWMDMLNTIYNTQFELH